MKKIIMILVMVALVYLAWLLPVYEAGKHRGREQMARIYWRQYDIPDPNYDPNDWVCEEPNNPILYIVDDTIRLQPGSSIRYIEVGDPNVEVSYFEPNKPTDLCIESNMAGMLIKDCHFMMGGAREQKTIK